MPAVVDVALFVEHLAAARLAGHRVLVHITGSEMFGVETAQLLLQTAQLSHCEYLPGSARQASLPQYLQTLLGTEMDALVVNAWQGFNPNALGVAAGCIRAGGALLLLTPAERDWVNYADPDYQRMLSPRHKNTQLAGRFVQHLLAVLLENPAVVRIDELATTAFFPVNTQKPAFVVNTAEQQIAIDAIKRVAVGHNKRPLVLQADRGRGKSSALGIAAAQLMQERCIRIVVTAPHGHCVQTLFRQAAGVLGLPCDNTLPVIFNNSSLQFMPIDMLLNSDVDMDVLLVDEAAALPSALLQRLLLRCKRLVFSTTVNGYEGNGRGFAVRFLPLLKQHFPQLKVMELTTPIRYALTDPLAQLCDAALLLKTLPAQMVSVVSPQFSLVNRDELLQNKLLLQQIFSLLVTAHYQTSPDDLRLLLDHPDVNIYTLQQRGIVLTVALLMTEGGFSDEDYQQSMEGNRRFRGHLLPQTLSVSGFAEVLKLRFLRIVRIAVLPECQHQSLGTQLIDAIEQQVDADFIGASFSAEADILRFWQKTGMQVLRLGVHKESSTGQYACTVLKALKLQHQLLMQDMQKAFVADLPYQLLTRNNDCDTALALALLQTACYPLQSHDRQQLLVYLRKQCSFEAVQASVYRVVLANAAHLQADNVPQALLVQKLLLNKTWQQLCTEFRLVGRAEVEALLRGALQVFMSSNL